MKGRCERVAPKRLLRGGVAVIKMNCYQYRISCNVRGRCDAVPLTSSDAQR